MSKAKVVVKSSYEEISSHCADIVEEAIKKNAKIVLGLATGSSPVGFYKQLIQRNKESKIDFSQVTTFNLDEVPNQSKKIICFNLFSLCFKSILVLILLTTRAITIS